MALKDTFGVDRNKSDNGVWIVVDVDDEGKEVRFKISHMSPSNKKLTKLNAEVHKPYRRLGNNMSDELTDKLAREVFVKGVLLDWENVVVKKGEPPLEFSYDNAIMLFKELPTLLDLLALTASDFQNFKGDADAAKNSQAFLPTN